MTMTRERTTPTTSSEGSVSSNVPTLVGRWLQDHRRAMVVWGLGIAAVAALYLPLYPSMRASGLLGDKLDALPSEMLDGFGMDTLTMSTPWGYTHQMVFSMLGVLVMLCLSISQGTRAIAGDEESGALELTLARAVSRSGVLLARLIGIAAVVGVVTLVLLAAVAVLSRPSELDLVATNLLAETLALYLLAMTFALLAVSVGAFTGRRTLTLGVASAVAVAMWFLHNMGSRIADWVPDLSPFQWAFGNTPLRQGFDAGGLAGLGIACAVLAAAAFVGFNRRDLRA